MSLRLASVASLAFIASAKSHHYEALCNSHGLMCDGVVPDQVAVPPKDIPEYSAKILFMSAPSPAGGNMTLTGDLYQFINASTSLLTTEIFGKTVSFATYEDHSTGLKYTVSSADQDVTCTISKASTSSNTVSIQYIGNTFINSVLVDGWVAANDDSSMNALFQNSFTQDDVAFVGNLNTPNQTSIIFGEFVGKADQRYKGIPASILPKCTEETGLEDGVHHHAKHAAKECHQHGQRRRAFAHHPSRHHGKGDHEHHKGHHKHHEAPHHGHHKGHHQHHEAPHHGHKGHHGHH